ncbi:DUF2165 family protein [Roseibium sp. RKSG952]|uniref:DUF2165 family protein n=1 Tax=Roseibium sp. RKSG952 TaxID=2529384 RepID=UPI0018AD2624|nr:DUF2165 domain-containing protein [Roseibium sp. RKSG952]
MLTTQDCLRLFKILLVASVGLFFLFVGITNIEQPSANLTYIKHIFSMDTVFSNNPATWRAITNPHVHAFVFWVIVVLEFVFAVLCLAGALKLALNFRADSNTFQAAKPLAMLGVGLGIIVWFTGFMVIGGEWFLMWQSEKWSGLQSSFRFTTIMLLILLFLSMREE